MKLLLLIARWLFVGLAVCGAACSSWLGVAGVLGMVAVACAARGKC